MVRRRLRTYQSEEVVVEYDIRRCIHAKECVHGLPKVFDPARRPWIDPALADGKELAAVIERCPTGALHYRWHGEGEPEQPTEANTVHVEANGPLYLRGRLEITLPGGETLEETRVALCRCGQSKDKPFCDSSHLETGFTDDGSIHERRLPSSDVDSRSLRVSFVRNGPILMRGDAELRSSEGSSTTGEPRSLCRCGASSAKPFCDQSHRELGFEAD